MAADADNRGCGGTSRLEGGRRRLLLLLAIPSLALALAVTTVSSLLPVLLQDLSGSALAGSLLAAEGIFALALPPLLGAWSDRLRTRLGPRVPFVLASSPAIVVALLLMGLVRSVPLAAALLVLFYLGYFGYFTPHFALYSDLVADEERGRSQGAMNLLREVGLGLALVGGPALLTLGRAVPFAAAAAVVLAVTAVFLLGLRHAGAGGRDLNDGDGGRRRSYGAELRETWSIVARNREVRLAVTANALWETALNSLRSFVVLYFTVGLGYSAGTASLVLLLVAIAALIVSPLSGWLADRYGTVRVLRVASVVYAAGLWPPAFLHPVWLVAIIPPIAAAAVTVMTLPFALLSDALPDEIAEDSGGQASGVFGFSRGIGLILGPLLGGVSVVACADILASSRGYGAIFLVATAAVTASAFVIRRMPVDTGG
jgi:Na+/melibiose symporter-like transporter